MRNQRGKWTQASVSKFLNSFYTSLGLALSAERGGNCCSCEENPTAVAGVQVVCGRQDTKCGRQEKQRRLSCKSTSRLLPHSAAKEGTFWGTHPKISD